MILFGATGTLGEGVLRECLLDPDVEQVLSIGRSPSGQKNPKLRESTHADFSHFTVIRALSYLAIMLFHRLRSGSFAR